METRGHTGLIDRIFGKMDDKQRTKVQNKVLRGVMWVLLCLGVALVINDDMLAKSWQWAMGLF